MLPEEFDSNYKLVADDKIKRVIACSGQVYVDLYEYREKMKITDVAIIRLEQIAPFPYHSVRKQLSRYPNADTVFCQEEHRNQGAWNYMKSRMGALLKDLGHPSGYLKFRGRPVSGSTAVGSMQRHKAEVEKLLTDAFDMK